MSSIFLQRLSAKLRKWLGNPRFLCDTCKYDYPSACHHPERPNAVVCPDYEKR